MFRTLNLIAIQRIIWSSIISYENNGVRQTLLINAESEEIATAYFKEYKPAATFYGINEATRSDERPGKPVIDVPADYSVETATEEEKEGKNTMTNTKNEQTILKEEYLKIIAAEVWNNDKKMLDFISKKISQVIKTSKGYLIPLDKPEIETRFCFGYSLSRYDTEDYDRANNIVQYIF